jgi:hypothetical protein
MAGSRMKFLVMLALVFTVFTAFSFQAKADDGSSGCGPGWYLFKENSLVSSALRATTNSILFPVTTIGMTFGTSNCTQHKLVLKEKESLYFATMNHFELKRDIAKGDGEYLSAFAATMGCSANAQAVLNKNLRTEYSHIYPDANVNPERTLLETYKTILNNKELTSKCSTGVS